MTPTCNPKHAPVALGSAPQNPTRHCQVLVFQDLRQTHMTPLQAARELAATLADTCRTGDLAGHLRAWWQSLHINPDEPITTTPTEG